MNQYAAFGGCLHSDVDIGILTQVYGRHADWILRTRATPAPAGSVLLGQDRVNQEVSVRLFRTPAGYRLDYDDTGSFEVAGRGRELTWSPPAEPDLSKAELDICGRLLATALHAGGLLCLHGSGVALPEGAVGFLAPKLHGKSTLAQALVRAGGLLVTDDVLPVEPGPPARARPGTQRLRLRSDSAERIAAGLISEEATVGRKHYVDQLPPESLLSQPVPLAALYLLTPIFDGRQGEAAVRLPVGPTDAVLAILRNTTLGCLLGGPEAPVLFERALELTRAVPVFELRYARDFGRLEEVVRVVTGWHETPASAAVEAPA